MDKGIIMSPSPSTSPKDESRITRLTQGERVGNRRLARAASREDFLPTFSKSFVSFLAEIVKVVLISVAIIVPIRYFLIQPFYVKGASMEPTFHDNEYLIIDEISYRWRQPVRGEVVVLKNPRGQRDYFIKRVIGLPGERLTIRNGVIRITNGQYPNGVALDEGAYLDPDIRTSGDVEVDLGPTEYYLLGDNRPASLDSRAFGPIDRRIIVGRTWIRAWPPQKLKAFSTPVYRLAAP